ncbi:hypothetical protein D3C75_700740 [compost metagenome]
MYSSVNIVPNIATIAAPIAVSSSLAFICGAMATTAAAPQIAVPQAVKILRRLSTLNSRASPYTTEIANIMTMTAKRNTRGPAATISFRLSRIPSKIIPRRSSFLLEKSVPCVMLFGTPIVARQIIPIKMAMTNCPIIDRNGKPAKNFANNAITKVSPIPNANPTFLL